MFTPTQLQNDPLLGGGDEIVADLGRSLRWAALGYGFVGIVAAWFVAAIVGLGLGISVSYAWAAAVTIVIVAVVVWYLTMVERVYRTTASYVQSRTPRALAALDRESVVGLRGEIGKWVGVAIGGLVVVSFVAAVVVSAAGAVNVGWPWFFVGVALALAYAFGYFALHVHLTEKARDAAVVTADEPV
ncbi:MAG TPA: hypothetical protein VN045_12565 [Microbacteriaceae bacterium]|nr:hypothetical protein [Microbacteriaceae bacterium]